MQFNEIPEIKMRSLAFLTFFSSGDGLSKKIREKKHVHRRSSDIIKFYANEINYN